MQPGDIGALDFADQPTSEVGHDVEAGDTLVLASGTCLSLRSNMFGHELVEHGRHGFVGLGIVPLACRILPNRNFSKQSLRLVAGSSGRQFSMLADGEATRAALASSEA